jgi:hypothetical protein
MDIEEAVRGNEDEALLGMDAIKQSRGLYGNWPGEEGNQNWVTCIEGGEERADDTS